MKHTNFKNFKSGFKICNMKGLETKEVHRHLLLFDEHSRKKKTKKFEI